MPMGSTWEAMQKNAEKIANAFDFVRRACPLAASRRRGPLMKYADLKAGRGMGLALPPFG
jgi:hypothetical protein